jgi:predicted transposase/invertase (TIGR01784 family)
MSYTNKTLEELDVLDDFLMNAVVATPGKGEEFCRILLSVLLQRKIGKIKVIGQRMLPALTPNMRGIRMDVEVQEFDEKESELPANIYDIEPNLRKDIHLPRHNRFYQAKIDGRHLKSGEKKFAELPNLYVITITNFDPFGYDYMMYRIRNQCIEVTDLCYDDGLEFIYFYTGGHKGGSETIKAMLRYLQDSNRQNVTDETTKQINSIVEQVRALPEVRNEYMTLGDIIDYEREEAAEEAATEATRAVLLECILACLRRQGEVSEELENKLKEAEDTDTLREWYNLALESTDNEKFILAIQ